MLDQCTECILVPLGMKFISNAGNPLVVKVSRYTLLWCPLKGFPPMFPFARLSLKTTTSLLHLTFSLFVHAHIP